VTKLLAKSKFQVFVKLKLFTTISFIYKFQPFCDSVCAVDSITGFLAITSISFEVYSVLYHFSSITDILVSTFDQTGQITFDLKVKSAVLFGSKLVTIKLIVQAFSSITIEPVSTNTQVQKSKLHEIYSTVQVL
jgi:hypothetical protein